MGRDAALSHILSLMERSEDLRLITARSTTASSLIPETLQFSQHYSTALILRRDVVENGERGVYRKPLTRLPCYLDVLSQRICAKNCSSTTKPNHQNSQVETKRTQARYFHPSTSPWPEFLTHVALLFDFQSPQSPSSQHWGGYLSIQRVPLISFLFHTRTELTKKRTEEKNR